ncbi:MAG: hypothetical protein AAF602_26955, partial [Myxococcota bacterium]
RSLSHPLWLASLGLLVVNDHVLKGAGLLPGMLTGKLSDFAGLIVAPALLALLLPASRRGWTLAHGLVGLGFGALQVVPGFAAVWDASLTAAGVPWATVADPTDLVALPALWLSWWVLEPSASAARPVRPWLPVAGFAACLATSPPDRFTDPPFTTEPITEFQVALVNDGEELLTVLTRPLRPDVVVDCAALAEDVPGELLADELFDVAVEWEMPPNTAISALPDPRVDGDCFAVFVDGPALEPHVVFWTARAPRFGVADPTDPSGDALSLVTFDDLDRGLVTPWAPREDPECLPAPALDRLDWSVPGPGSFTIGAINASPDGCLEVVSEADEAMVLCIPGSAFVFEVGERLFVNESPGRLELRGPSADLYLAHVVRWTDTIAGLSVGVVEPVESCGLRIEPTCGHVTDDAVVEVSGRTGAPSSTLSPGGEPAYFEGLLGATLEVTVTRAERRAVSVTDCGRPAGPFDIDIVVLSTEER